MNVVEVLEIILYIAVIIFILLGCFFIFFAFFSTRSLSECDSTCSLSESDDDFEIYLLNKCYRELFDLGMLVKDLDQEIENIKSDKTEVED